MYKLETSYAKVLYKICNSKYKWNDATVNEN